MTVPLDTVNDIRSVDAAGRSRSEIARMLHVSRNTVAKYADMEDMSPAAPMPQRRGRPALEGSEEWVWIGYTYVDSSGRGARETGGPYMRDPRHPRHFTDEFKRQIVDLYNAGKPKREIMDEYDLGKSTVERRVKSINATGSPRAADNRTPEQNRVLELERENRRLRMEVDVLKQAALIYARK